MSKVSRRPKRKAEAILEWADRLGAHANDPASPDDPKWLRRQALYRRIYAQRRLRALERKQE